MGFDAFSRGRSVLHRIDPRVKILTFIPLVFTVALGASSERAGFFLLLGIGCVLSARVPLKLLASRWLAVNVFTLALWFTLPFSVDGEILWRIGGLGLSREGVQDALLITMKANALLLLTIGVIGTTDVFSLAHALFHLRCPRKLVYLWIFLYRYITVFEEEYLRLVNTARARSFQPGPNRNTLRTYARMVGMLFVSGYERSERIFRALTFRGFRGDFPMLRHFLIHPVDILFSVVIFGLICGAWMRWI